MPVAEPLSSFPVVDTDNVELAEHEISRLLADCRILRVARGQPFHVKMNARKLGQCAFVFNRYDSDASIEVPLQDDVLHFVFGGGVPTTFAWNGGSVTAHSGRCVTLPIGRSVGIHRPAGSEVLVVNASARGLARHLGMLTDRPQTTPPHFAESADLSTGEGAAVARRLRFALKEIETASTDAAHPALQRGLDEMVLSTLLALPHSQSEALSHPRYHALESDAVHRAAEYMQAHFREPVAISDVLRVTGLSRSVLFAAFRSAQGCTPKAFLTELRLAEARAGLRRAEPTDTVRSIAMAAGFMHLGRFSRQYRLRFGELPSETLLRAKS